MQFYCGRNVLRIAEVRSGKENFSYSVPIPFVYDKLNSLPK